LTAKYHNSTFDSTAGSIKLTNTGNYFRNDYINANLAGTVAADSLQLYNSTNTELNNIRVAAGSLNVTANGTIRQLGFNGIRMRGNGSGGGGATFQVNSSVPGTVLDINLSYAPNNFGGGVVTFRAGGTGPATVGSQSLRDTSSLATISGATPTAVFAPFHPGS